MFVSIPTILLFILGKQNFMCVLSKEEYESTSSNMEKQKALRGEKYKNKIG